MAEISFDLPQLFELTFGYKTRAFNPQFSGGYGSRAVQGKQGSPYYAGDAMGKEYFMPVTLVYEDAAAGRSVRYSLPYPIVSVSGRKTIIETPLSERRGTVKELICQRDYEIVIRGFIIGTNNEFPENEVTRLRDVYEQNTALSIECPLTDIFLLRPDRKGSDQVVIYGLDLPEIKGVKNVRPYCIRMLSDEAFDLVEIG